jgi:hypothetical protein
MISPKTTRKSSFCGNSRFPAAACLLLGVIVLVCPTDRSISRAESVPDWLATANHVDLGHLGDGAAAVIVGEWNDFTVDATGKFVSTERRAIRVLNRRSADRYLKAVGYENNDTKVQSIQTWSISPSGRIVLSGKKDLITEAGFAEFELFSDDRVKLINIPGAEDGSLVGFEIVTQGRIPISGEKFRMEEEIPIHQGDLNVSVPAGSMRWFVNHPDRVEVVSQSPTSAVFRAVDRPGIPEESSAPPFSSLAAEVVVNYDPKGSSALQSWEEAGRAYHSLFDSPEKPGTEIASQVETLANGKSDELSKIDALYNFVSREIRYVAIEIGVGGYQPHPAADVYKNRYGDCKDKATLLLTMLDHIGLRGYPALVGTRRDVEADPNVPTLATFDHMIVALPVPASLRPAVARFPAYDPQSQILWIDPTSEADPLGQVPEMDQGVFALISYPDHGDLRRIPESQPEQNGTRYTAQVRLQPDGTGTADVRVEYFGAYNTRRHYFYRGLSQDEIRRQFENRVARYVNQATFQKASISGIEDSRQEIAEMFSFSGDFTTASTGDSWFLQPLFLSGLAVPEVGPRPRQLPLDIGTPERISGAYRIELPTGMRFDRVPDKSSVKSEFGELDVEYAVSENVLTVAHTLSFTQSRISPEKYPEFRDFVNAVLRAERQRLRVSKIALEDLPALK